MPAIFYEKQISMGEHAKYTVCIPKSLYRKFIKTLITIKQQKNIPIIICHLETHAEAGNTDAMTFQDFQKNILPEYL